MICEGRPIVGALPHCDDSLDVLASAEGPRGTPNRRGAKYNARSNMNASIGSPKNTLIPEILKRALSIRQPLSELILLGEKTLEFRSRLTRIRERVYLYAGKKLALVDDFPEEEAQLPPR